MCNAMRKQYNFCFCFNSPFQSLACMHAPLVTAECCALIIITGISSRNDIIQSIFASYVVAVTHSLSHDMILNEHLDQHGPKNVGAFASLPSVGFWKSGHLIHFASRNSTQNPTIGFCSDCIVKKTSYFDFRYFSNYNRSLDRANQAHSRILPRFMSLLHIRASNAFLLLFVCFSSNFFAHFIRRLPFSCEFSRLVSCVTFYFICEVTASRKLARTHTRLYRRRQSRFKASEEAK